MPIDARIPLGAAGVDPNGFVNALAAGMKARELQNEADRLARKDELADTKRNALRTYGASGRTSEDLNALWAADPDAAAGIEKTAATAALNTAKTDTATAQGDKARLEGQLQQVELGSRLLAGVHDQPTYDAAMAQARKLNLDLSDAPERFFPDWVNQRRQQGLKAKDQLSLQLQELNVNSQIEDRTARRTETALYHDSLDADRDAGRVETNRHNLVQESKKPGGGFTVYDPETGKPMVQVGGAAPFGKSATTKLEETQIQGIEGLARLDEIRRLAKPELLTYGNKIKDWGLDVKSKAGFDLSPEDQKFRNDYTGMRQATMVNLNKTIKDQTGATITENEVPRIMATVPTMDDAPDQYPTKLDGAERLLRNSVIRAQLAREQGMDPLQSGIDLGDTKTLMSKREEQLKRHYAGRAPGMTPADVEAAIEKRLMREFGY
jgi:hypothetical protein